MTTHAPVLNTAAFSSVPAVTETYFVVVEVSPKSTPDRPIYLAAARPVATKAEAEAALADQQAKGPTRALSIIEVQDQVSRTITIH